MTGMTDHEREVAQAARQALAELGVDWKARAKSAEAKLAKIQALVDHPSVYSLRKRDIRAILNDEPAPARGGSLRTGLTDHLGGRQ